MKTLEQIKNDYSVSEGYDNFNDLLNGFLEYKDLETMNKHVENILKEYAMECLKLASENAIVEKEYSIRYECFIPEGVCKESITNENNIIK